MDIIQQELDDILRSIVGSPVDRGPERSSEVLLLKITPFSVIFRYSGLCVVLFLVVGRQRALAPRDCNFHCTAAWQIGTSSPGIFSVKLREVLATGERAADAPNSIGDMSGSSEFQVVIVQDWDVVEDRKNKFNGQADEMHFEGNSVDGKTF